MSILPTTVSVFSRSLCCAGRRRRSLPWKATLGTATAIYPGWQWFGTTLSSQTTWSVNVPKTCRSFPSKSWRQKTTAVEVRRLGRKTKSTNVITAFFLSADMTKFGWIPLALLISTLMVLFCLFCYVAFRCYEVKRKNEGIPHDRG